MQREETKMNESQELTNENALIRKKLEDIAIQLNKGVEIDWKNSNQKKYFLAFDILEDDRVTDFTTTIKIEGPVYCLSSCFYDIAVREIGVDRLTRYLRGE